MLSPSSWYDSPLPKSIRYQKMNRSAAFLKLLLVGPTSRPIHKKFWWSQLFLTERHSNVCPKTGFPQIPWFIMVYHHFPIKFAMVYVSTHFSTWACDNLKTKSPNHDEFRQRSCGRQRENPILRTLVFSGLLSITFPGWVAPTFLKRCGSAHPSSTGDN